jgi:hypothetical protein
MEIKTDGRLYDAVVQGLIERGEDPARIGVATLSRGTDHLVLRGEDTIGEYNHRSKKLVLYDN